MGDDSDTTAYVTGDLVRTMYGLASILQEWMEWLRGKEIIESGLFWPLCKVTSASPRW